MKKDNKRYLRLIYTRFLDRAISKVVKLLSKEQITNDELLCLIETLNKKYEKIEKIALDNEYYKNLDTIWQTLQNIDKNELKDLDSFGAKFLHKANQLQKQKRIKKSKNPKHKSSIYDDGN